MRLIRLFCLLSVMLCVNVCPVLAKAPTTAKILFTSARDGNYEVYIMNPDGSEQLNLTQHRAQDLEAVWSPTGEQILFVSDRDGVRDLYLMDPDGTHVRRVFKREANRDDPTWAPDGNQIAYTYTNGEGLPSFISIATLGEQEEERVVKGFFPAWAPDGMELAYITYVAFGHTRRVTLMNIRTRKPNRLLPKKAMDWQNHPAWSAAGGKLAFSWNKHPLPPDHNPLVDAFPVEWRNKETIYLVNRDGTGLEQLVAEAGAYAQYAAFSPDGAAVLYTQKTKGQFQVFKVDVKSGIVTQLTHIGWNLGGDWFDPAYALPVSPQPRLLTTVWGAVKKE